MEVADELGLIFCYIPFLGGQDKENNVDEKLARMAADIEQLGYDIIQL